MAKSRITREKLISDEALEAPRLLAESLDETVKSLERLIEAGKKSNVILDKAKSTADLASETKKLTDSQKELEKIEARIQKEVAKSSDEYKEKVKELKKTQKATRDQIKEEIENEQAMDKTLGTEERLRASNKALRNERRKLNLETEEGRMRLLEINEEIDSNTASLKGLSDSYTQQKMEIGDYRGQLEGLLVNMESLTGAEGGLSSLFATLTGGLVSSTKAALRFIATPIGAILAAIVVAISAVGAAFSSNAEGAKMFNEIMSGVGDVLDFLLGRFAMVGNAIIKLLSGDFSGAAAEAEKAITGLGEGIKDAYNEGVAYERLLREIKKQTIENTTATAKLQAELDILNQRAGDATISLREQNKAAIAASKAQIDLTDQKLKLIELELDAADRQLQKAIKNASSEILEKKQAYAEAKAAFIEAEAEQTLALAENVTLRRQIRQDEGEQYLDFLIDNFDNIKTVNERIIANEKKTFDSRRDLLLQTTKLGEQSFKEQIALLQEFTDVTINANDLLNQTDSTALFEAVEALGMSEILNQRMLEVIRERRTAVQDLEEAYRDLQDSQGVFDRLEPLNLEVEMPDFSDGLPGIEDLKTSLTAQEQAILDSYDNRHEMARQNARLIQDVLVGSMMETANLVTEITQGQLSQVEGQLESLNERKEHELDMAGRNAQERIEIEQRFLEEEKALEEERAQLMRRQAIADKTIAITQAVIGTAQGITNALKIQPAPLGIALAAIIGGIGAAQIATIATQPIPQFWKGTEYSPEGYAFVNEKGDELLEKDGKFSMVESDGAALTYLKRGTKVHTAEETQKILASGVTGGISVGKSENTEMYNTGMIVSGLDKINSSIKKQKQLHINTTKEGVETLLKHGHNYTKLINGDFK